MFCTTDPQKVPVTIQNRVMKFNLTKIDSESIKKRLDYICEQEHFTNYTESTDYLAKLAQGGMRDAISLLEKASCYDTNLTIDNVLNSLGSFSYESFFKLTNNLVDYSLSTSSDRSQYESNIIDIVESYYNSGFDLKMFIEQYIDFVLDLDKYCLFKSMSVVRIPVSMERDVKYSVDDGNFVKYFNWLVDELLKVKSAIKYDSNVKTTIEIMLLNICRQGIER